MITNSFMKKLILLLGILFCSVAIAKPIESYRLPRTILIGSQNCYSNSIQLYQVLKLYFPSTLINDSDCLLNDGTTVTKKVNKEDIPNSFARDWIPNFLEAESSNIQMALHKQKPSLDFLNNYFAYDSNNIKHLPFAGGNLQIDDDGTCIIAYPSYAADLSGYAEIVKKYNEIGCIKIVRLEPAFAERTQHVDIFLQITGKKQVLLADYSANSNKRANEIMDQNLKILTENGFKIKRVRQPGTIGIHNSFVHISYINSLIIGNKVFMPKYGLSYDSEAIEDFRRAGLSVVLVNQDLPWLFGSIHCLTAPIY